MNIKLTFKYKFLTTANVESLQEEHYKMFLIKPVSKLLVAFKIFCECNPHEDYFLYALNGFFTGMIWYSFCKCLCVCFSKVWEIGEYER